MVETGISFRLNICRTCLRKISASDSMAIFSDKQFYKDQTLSQVFTEITHTLINPQEKLPINICLKCAESVKRTVAFKRSIETADRTLRSKLRLVEMRHCMKQVASVTLALDDICNDLNEICYEYETSNNKKPPEVAPETKKTNIRQTPVNMKQLQAWQKDIERILKEKTTPMPKHAVKITNKTLNRVKEIIPKGNIKKLVSNSKNDSVNTNQLNINNKNNKTQHEQKSEKSPLLDKHTDNNNDPLLVMPKISKVYSAKSNNVKNTIRNDPNQNDSVIIDDIMDSAISDAIIILENEENPDICQIIQVIEDQPTIEISDEEDETQSPPMIDVGPQNQTHNLEKRNYNLQKENHNLEETSKLEKQQYTADKEKDNVEQDLTWINIETNLLHNSEAFQVNPEKLVCGKCDKTFTTTTFLQRHLLYHSLNLEPTDKTETQNDENVNCTMTVADVYRRAEEISNSCKKPDTNLQRESVIDLTGQAQNFSILETRLRRKQNPRKVCFHSRRTVTDAKVQEVIGNIDRNCNYSTPKIPQTAFVPPPVEVKEEECKYCMILMNQADLHTHILQEHKDLYKKEIRDFRIRHYRCKHCPERYKNVLRVLNHMKIQHVAKFDCSHCDENFIGRAPLMEHLRKFHGIKETSLCDICGKMVTGANLRMHIKTHTNTKSIKCTVKGCNVLLKYQSSLRDHIKIVHENQKPFICEHCGKRFGFKRNLMHHLCAHMEVLPYNCVICEKGFALRSRLKKHLVSHQYSKPYSCPVCPQTFGHKESIKKHCVRYHPEDEVAQNSPQYLKQKYAVKSTQKTIECKLCQRKFAYEYTLKKHNRTFHPLLYFNLKRKQLNNDSTIEEIINQENNYFKTFLN